MVVYGNVEWLGSFQSTIYHGMSAILARNLKQVVLVNASTMWFKADVPEGNARMFRGLNAVMTRQKLSPYSEIIKPDPDKTHIMLTRVALESIKQLCTEEPQGTS